MILAWRQHDISGLSVLGISVIWTEVDDSGKVTREIGFGADCEVLYVAPSDSKKFGRGLFDGQSVDTKDHEADMPSPDEFERLWRDFMRGDM